MPQELLTFPFWNHVFFAFLGAGLLYMQWGRSKLKAFAFAYFLDMFEMSKKTRMRLEMLIFVLVGTIVTMELTQPSTGMQAFSAGLGWTGLVAKPCSNESRRTKRTD
jgi:hypothetical protein